MANKGPTECFLGGGRKREPKKKNNGDEVSIGRFRQVVLAQREHSSARILCYAQRQFSTSCHPSSTAYTQVILAPFCLNALGVIVVLRTIMRVVSKAWASDTIILGFCLSTRTIYQIYGSQIRNPALNFKTPAPHSKFVSLHRLWHAFHASAYFQASILRANLDYKQRTLSLEWYGVCPTLLTPFHGFVLQAIDKQRYLVNRERKRS